MTATEAVTVTCTYCGEPTPDPTRDHVIPSALWVKGERPQSPAIVPTCPECHAELDRNAAYFRNLLTVIADADAHPMVRKLASGPVAHSIQRNRTEFADLTRDMRPAFKTTDSGIVTGRGYRVAWDMERFNSIAEKIVRGLFYCKSQFALPSTHIVKVFPGNGFWDVEGFQSLLPKMEPFMGVGDTVFLCRCVHDNTDPCATAWLLVFFTDVPIFAWTERGAKPDGDASAVSNR